MPASSSSTPIAVRGRAEEHRVDDAPSRLGRPAARAGARYGQRRLVADVRRRIASSCSARTSVSAGPMGRVVRGERHDRRVAAAGVADASHRDDRRARAGAPSPRRRAPGSAPARSILLTKISVGTWSRWSARNRSGVCGWTPSTAETTRTAPSSTPRTRSTSAMKSGWPGVSTRLTARSPTRNEATADRIVMPRSRSSSSESVWVVPASTLPTWSIAPAVKRSRSLRVVLPASTWARIPRLSVRMGPHVFQGGGHLLAGHGCSHSLLSRFSRKPRDCRSQTFARAVKSRYGLVPVCSYALVDGVATEGDRWPDTPIDAVAAAAGARLPSRLRERSVAWVDGSAA